MRRPFQNLVFYRCKNSTKMYVFSRWKVKKSRTVGTKHLFMVHGSCFYDKNHAIWKIPEFTMHYTDEFDSGAAQFRYYIDKNAYKRVLGFRMYAFHRWVPTPSRRMYAFLRNIIAKKALENLHFKGFCRLGVFIWRAGAPQCYSFWVLSASSDGTFLSL